MPQGIWIVSKHTGLKDWATWNAAANKGAQDSRPECSHVPHNADILTNTSRGEMASRLQSFLKQTYGPERVKHRLLPTWNGYLCLKLHTYGRQVSRALPIPSVSGAWHEPLHPLLPIPLWLPLGLYLRSTAQALPLARATMPQPLDYSLVFCSV